MKKLVIGCIAVIWMFPSWIYAQVNWQTYAGSIVLSETNTSGSISGIGSNSTNLNISGSLSGSGSNTFDAIIPAGAPSRLSLSSNFANTSSTTTLVLTLSNPMCGLTFDIYDVDISSSNQFIDKVTVSASGSSSSSILPSNISSGSTNTVSGNVITGTSSGSSSNTVTFLGVCINSITITLTTGLVPGNPNTQNIGIGNLVSGAGSPLPIRLVDFDARQGLQHVSLAWEGEDEVNFKQFDIQRSNDAVSFETIGSVEQSISAVGSKKVYSFKDNNPEVGTNYYRLKMIDIDESYTFSKIIAFRYLKDNFVVSAYPNPLPSGSILNLESSESIREIKILDMKGKLLDLYSNVDQIKLNHAGGYMFLFISEDGRKYTHRIVVK
ncbi:MAG: T9SS type A sorting domain-containing protein [Leadbetterella sp.]